ncbi:YpsA SLOG family protein [Verrucomicrobiota bacterium]
MPITKIISGGQTRASIGGLDAAIYCDLPHGVWCPKGRKGALKKQMIYDAVKQSP